MIAIFRTNFDTVRHFDCIHCSCDLTEFRKEIIRFVFTENLFEKFDFHRFRFTVTGACKLSARFSEKFQIYRDSCVLTRFFKLAIQKVLASKTRIKLTRANWKMFRIKCILYFHEILQIRFLQIRAQIQTANSSRSRFETNWNFSSEIWSQCKWYKILLW